MMVHIALLAKDATSGNTANVRVSLKKRLKRTTFTLSALTASVKKRRLLGQRYLL